LRKFVLLLAFGAMGVGGYKLVTDGSPEFLQEQIERLGIDKLFGSGHGHDGGSSGGGAKIRMISTGESVDIEKYVDPQGTTIVDFTADW
jgi:hypothetical protein